MKLALIFGTRPEIVKIAPLILEAQRLANIDAIAINTAQHTNIVDDVLRWFNISADVTLERRESSPATTATPPLAPTAPAPAPVETATDGLNQLSAHLFTQLDDTLKDLKPDAVLVQGDTTTVSIAAHAATNLRIPVIHLEAGLRSSNRWSPFPEELNRRTVSALASLHLTPTPRATSNLLREGIDDSDIAEVGNTVIDALIWTSQQDISWEGTELETIMAPTGPTAQTEISQRPARRRRIVAITCHRRENWGSKLGRVSLM